MMQNHAEKVGKLCFTAQKQIEEQNCCFRIDCNRPSYRPLRPTRAVVVGVVHARGQTMGKDDTGMI